METTTSSSSIHTEMPTLKGKRVFITGGTTGIGRAIANLLGSEGADIFICGRHQPELTDALEDVRAVLDRRVDVAGGVAQIRFPADKPQVAKAARP